MSKDVEYVVRLIANTVFENEQYFSELDGVVGDGDFGYSIARGFEKVINEWDTIDHSLPGNTLKGVSMKIVGAVGGVSGTVWGTAFLRAGITLGTKTEITQQDVIAMFRSAIEGIKKRGNTDLGDKTLLDALVPAVDQLEKSFNDGKDASTALDEAAVVCRQAAEATRPMLAKRGRAAYTGERSIGTLDAGAVAMAVLFEAVSKAWKE
ncbi:MAG: dhaL [Chloroflexi bacterium]|jgi:dihydroxyacetone kinase/dihydroxyacetone kinase-like protein|nr:dhaL [Chloroflexota bacterium]